MASPMQQAMQQVGYGGQQPMDPLAAQQAAMANYRAPTLQQPQGGQTGMGLQQMMGMRKPQALQDEQQMSGPGMQQAMADAAG